MARYYIAISPTAYVRFNAPVANYTNLLADLGVEGIPPAGIRLKGSVFNYPVTAFRVTLDAGGLNPPTYGRVLCAPANAGTAPAALVGKTYKGQTILEANPIRRRILAP
ncbi:hypothetical protein AB3R30_21675 [Leptolyngbyaceae cyanobacterium UHCC 1019]